MTTESRSTSADIDVHWSGWVQVPQAPRRSAVIAWTVLENLCHWTGHIGGCGLLNRWFDIYRGERRIVAFRNPLYRFVCWAETRGRTSRYVPIREDPVIADRLRRYVG